MAQTRFPSTDLQEHQVFWNERGEVCCACCHLPYPGSDTWVFERWSEITPDLMVEIDKQGGGRVACDGCGKEPSRIVREPIRSSPMSKKQTKKTNKAATKNAETVEAPVVVAGPAKGKRTRKGATETTEQAPAQPPAPEIAQTDDAEEICVFAFRLTRSERDAIHAAAGSAKASKFVKGLAVAAARGDIDTIHGIVAEVVDGSKRS